MAITPNSRVLVRVFRLGFLVSILAANFQLAYCEALSYKCPEIPTDPRIEQWKAQEMAFDASLQGKLKYPTATDVTQARRTSSIDMSRELNSIPGIAGRGFNFLLVRHAGIHDVGAIEIAFDDRRPFACFARPGDVVQLRSSFGISHFTRLYKLDSEHDQVQLLDGWPEQFAFLKSNSGGKYHGSLEQSNGISIVVMSLKEFDSILYAVDTLDYSSFAAFLLSQDCNCVSSSVSVQTIFDALLLSHHPPDLAVAVSNLNAWARVSAPLDRLRAYSVATLYIGPSINTDLRTEENADRLASLFRAGRPEGFFDPLSESVKIALLGVCAPAQKPSFSPLQGLGDESLDPLTKSLVASIEEDIRGDKLTKVQKAIVVWNRGRLMFGVDNVLALQRLNDVIPIFKSLQEELTTSLKNSAITDPEHGSTQLQLVSVMQSRISAHEDLLHLYIGSKDPINAGINFTQLVDLHSPLPWLLDDARLACKEFKEPSGLETANQLTADLSDEENVRAKLKSLSCFRDKSTGFDPQSEDTEGPAKGPAEAKSTSSNDRSNDWLKGKWQAWELRDGNCFSRGSLRMELVLGDLTSSAKAGEFSASHLGGDSCIDFIEDRTFCEAVWSVRVTGYDGDTALLAGKLDDLSRCGDLVRSRTPADIKLSIRRLGPSKIAIESNLSETWNSNWFRSKVETFSLSDPRTK